MKRVLGLLAIVLLMSSCGPNIHSAYYTNSSSAGYNQQVIGVKCPSCGRTGQISWNQFNNIKEVKCPYCGVMMNTRQTAAAFKYDSNQANSYSLGNAITDFSKGMQSYKPKSTSNPYSNSGTLDSKCQQKTYNIYSNGKNTLCTQDIFCNVSCF